MSHKTTIEAPEGSQDISITRIFELPVEKLFLAYTEAEIIEQWMGTKVVALENKKHGFWHFQTSNPTGQVVFESRGVYHDFVPNKSIIRTFEKAHPDFTAQLEFLEFTSLSPESSQLSMHIIFRSPAYRNHQMSLPFAQGLNMAHNRLEQIVNHKS